MLCLVVRILRSARGVSDTSISFSRSSVCAKGQVLTVYHNIDRELVHAFYDAALKHGGKSNGGPGVRPQ